MKTAETDVAVVGAGFTGLLAARELVRAGREVTVIERGALKTHAEQLRDGAHEVALPTTAHTHESPTGEEYPWNYVQGVGGGSLHWTGAAPRLLPSDFELQTRFGVGRDWPLPYYELVPFYEEAESLLGVAGEDTAHPSHEHSPTDRIVGPLLAPFGPMPQSRSSRSVNGRPRCCGNTACELCPVDARQSMLHLLDDEGLLDRSGLTLWQGTAVSRLKVRGRRIHSIELISATKELTTLHARTIVLAAGSFENPGILLRSDLGGPHVGSWLNDHGHRTLHFELDRPVDAGRGSSLSTGLTHAYADGDFRSRRGSQIAIVVNQGLARPQAVVRAVLSAGGGAEVRERLRHQFSRTLLLDTLGEDLPNPACRVELSPLKDQLGLPRNRVRYSPPSDYLEDGRRAMYEDLERRLRPLGARLIREERAGEGSHQLGTCFAGYNDGVVDGDLRHHALSNLYVAGGSAFPSYSAYHPTLTISALALRLGRHLAMER